MFFPPKHNPGSVLPACLDHVLKNKKIDSDLKEAEGVVSKDRF